jgi:hypothetical protein
MPNINPFGEDYFPPVKWDPTLTAKEAADPFASTHYPKHGLGTERNKNRRRNKRRLEEKLREQREAGGDVDMLDVDEEMPQEGEEKTLAIRGKENLPEGKEEAHTSRSKRESRSEKGMDNRTDVGVK